MNGANNPFTVTLSAMDFMYCLNLIQLCRPEYKDKFCYAYSPELIQRNLRLVDDILSEYGRDLNRRMIEAAKRNPNE